MTSRLVSRITPVRLALLVGAGALAFSALPLTAQQGPDLFRSISFREIGPTHRGGRFVDFAVVESTPRIFYAVAATGGVWKTENGGGSYTQIFDSPTAGSYGAIAVSQSNPDILYLGTGEANNSRSSYWGDGVYKSTDAGRTWTNVGLKDSQHIGRIVIHPTDPNTVYVAALGHLYSENAERGLYKTTDGGKTWTKSLGPNVGGKDIGAIDVAMDPKNPLVLYAATYDKVRRPWTFAEGGPGSALHKTTDGGKTWTKLSGGLPIGYLGRIGVSISRQDPNVVYTVMENVGVLNEEQQKRYAEGFGANSGSPSQLYRSNDAGKTWRQVAPNADPGAAAASAAGAAAAGQGRGAAGAGAAGAGAAGRQGGGGGRGNFDGGNPGYYYAQVRVDPNDKETVYVLSVGWSRSRDGGLTWQGMGFGGDNHALWIDPKNSDHMLLGYDHGLGQSVDGGQTWSRPDNLPVAQTYAVGIDTKVPYNVYTGLQDNGCVMGPSTRRGGGNIPLEEWANVGCADGFYNEVDIENHYLYNSSQFGDISRRDLNTGQTFNPQSGRPQPPAPYRWNWSAPIVTSHHDAHTVFQGAQYLLRSTTDGERWDIISPDLTVNDPAKRGGGGNVTWATITTIDESPIVPGLLWVGTDDGNVQVTRDGGATWTNVRDKIPGHPGYWVSRVAASNLSPGTAYVSMTGYRNDDFKPFVWKTTDFGATWTSMAGNLPNQAINVIRESPRNADVLFVGTDLGVFASLNGGKSWSQLKGNAIAAAGGGGRGAGGGRGGGAAAMPRGILPTVAVHDLKIHPRDRELVVATHGRGIWIADISNLEEMTPAVLASDAHLFEIDPVIDWDASGRFTPSAQNFAGVSRPTDMGIEYYLKSDASGDVKVRVYNGARVIAEIDGPKTAGVNTVRWNLQMRREQIAGEAAPAGGRGGRGGGGAGRGGGAPPAAAPPAGGGPTYANVGEAPIGTYRVVLTVGGKEYAQQAWIVADPGK
ncbi:MAG TPA: hypothetical protein VFV78_02310 [Vicinamibacterales bacterium]|nr:hypothetical protein [Vicinamibacterales bacterium]